MCVSVYRESSVQFKKNVHVYKLVDKNLGVISIGRKIELNKSTTVSICILRSSR